MGITGNWDCMDLLSWNKMMNISTGFLTNRLSDAPQKYGADIPVLTSFLATHPHEIPLASLRHLNASAAIFNVLIQQRKIAQDSTDTGMWCQGDTRVATRIQKLIRPVAHTIYIPSVGSRRIWNAGLKCIFFFDHV